MAVTDWRRPGTGSNVDRDGKGAWTYPDNIQYGWSEYASDLILNDYNDWLQGSNFGFDDVVASDAIIVGIELRIARASSGDITDSSLRLVDGDGNMVGDNKASATAWTSGWEVVTYGGALDDWNGNITAADVRDSDFGFRLSVVTTDSPGFPYVAFFEARIHYTPSLSITIGGTERRSNIPIESIEIENVLTRQIDTCRFTVENGSGFSLQELQEVIIGYGDDDRYFAGFIETLEEVESCSGVELDYNITCVDYTWLLEHPEELVNEEYEDKSDQYMIQDFMPTACPDIEVSTYVKDLYTHDGVVRFSRMTPRQAIERLADASGGDYYVDYGPVSGTSSDKAYLRYFGSEEYDAPFDLSDSPDMSTTYPIENLVKTTHAPAANIVEVVGGHYLSSDQTIYLNADGTQTELDLPYRIRPQEGESALEIWVNDGTDGTPSWTSKTVGTKYLHDDLLGTTYDVLYAYQEKFLEFNTAPSELDLAVKIECRQEVPVRVRVGSYPSFAEYSRWMMTRLVDKSINSKDLARKRGKAILADEALAAPRFRCTVREIGLQAGQLINLAVSNRSIDEEYLIQRVTTRFEAGGDRAVCDLELGVYDPSLVDLLLNIKRQEEVSWSEEDTLDELLETTETFALADTSESITATGINYDWSPGDDNDDLVWSFGRWT